MSSAPQSTFLSWDDTTIISDNPVVNGGLSLENILLALKTEVLNLWHPLTLWSHQLDVTLFGLNPDLHHLSALCYHLLAGLALFFALLQIKTPPSFDPTHSHRPLISKGIATFTTCLFLLHPMHVESWAWLSERKDTLSALFAFLSLASWARFNSLNNSSFSSRQSKINYGLSLLFLACGLMSKPSLIIWPAVLLFTAHWQAPRPTLKDHLPTLKQLTPHLFLCALVALITYSFQLGRESDLLTVISTRPPHQNLLAGFNNLWLYFFKIIYPHPLSYFYPPLKSYPLFGSSLGLLLSATFTYFSWRLRHTFPLLLWAWGSFLITLAPVCGFIISGEANAPDRYSYLAYTGPFLLLSFLVSRGLQRLPFTPQKKKLLTRSLALLILIPLGLLSAKRAPAWQNMETLTHAAIRSHPHSYAPHHHLALHYLRHDQPQKARPHLERALKLHEGNRALWAHLGTLEHEAGNTATAQKHFLKQLLHAPNNLNAHIGLIQIYLAEGNEQAAQPYLKKAIQLVPPNSIHQKTLQRYLKPSS